MESQTLVVNGEQVYNAITKLNTFTVYPDFSDLCIEHHIAAFFFV